MTTNANGRRSEEGCALLMLTLNEVQGLRAIYPRIDRTLFDEIVVVDGGSTDGTVEFCQGQGISVVRQQVKGLPQGMRLGFESTTSEIVVVFSPDGNSLPEKLPEVCGKMRDGNDLVIVSRYLEGAGSEDDDAITAFGNWFFTRLVNVLFGARYSDVFVMFRGYRREAVKRMRIFEQLSTSWHHRNVVYVNSWEVTSVTRAARLGLRVAEVPGAEPPRIGGTRKLRVFRQGLGCFFQIVEEFVLFRPPAGADETCAGTAKSASTAGGFRRNETGCSSSGE